MHLSRIFTLIGIAFGAMFVFVNAGDLPDPWPLVARISGGVAAIAAIWSGMTRPTPTTPAPDAQALRAYWMALAFELIAIPVGAMVLNIVFDRPELVVLWVVLVVGAHFLPANAFGVPHISLLGGVLIVMAIAGAVGTLTIDDQIAPTVAVITGFVLLAFSAMTSWTAGENTATQRD